MENQIFNTFPRSLGFLKFLGLHKEVHYLFPKKQIEQLDLGELISLDIIKTKTDKTGLRKLVEIFEIEKEKILLGDGSDIIKSILDQEAKQVKAMETIMSKFTTDALTELSFKCNPFLQIYECDWDWIGEYVGNSLDYSQILSLEAEDLYFIFLRTGIFDERTKTNVIELSINEYQYFLLQLFESSKPIKDVIATFCAEFDDVSEENQQLVRQFAEKMIVELILKRYIVQS